MNAVVGAEAGPRRLIPSTRPSRPMTPTSAPMPSDMKVTTEAIPEVMKWANAGICPGLVRTVPTGRSTGVRRAIIDDFSSAGRALMIRFDNSAAIGDPLRQSQGIPPDWREELRLQQK